MIDYKEYREFLRGIIKNITKGIEIDLGDLYKVVNIGDVEILNILDIEDSRMLITSKIYDKYYLINVKKDEETLLLEELSKKKYISIGDMETIKNMFLMEDYYYYEDDKSFEFHSHLGLFYIFKVNEDLEYERDLYLGDNPL